MEPENHSPSRAEQKITFQQTALIRQEVRNLLHHYAEQQFNRLRPLIDDRLFELSEKANNGSLESEYFMTMRMLRKEADAMRQNFKSAMLAQYDAYWDPAKAKSNVVGQPETTDQEAVHGETSLTILTQDAFEEELAVASMAEKGKSNFRQSLFDLNQRFSLLTGRSSPDDDDNPVGPMAFGKSFAKSIEGLQLNVSTRLLLYKLFEQIVVVNLEPFLAEVDQLLSSHGCLSVAAEIVRNPDTSRTPTRRPVRKRGPDSLEKTERKYQSGDNKVELIESFNQFFEGLQEFVVQWRSRLGVSASEGSAPAALTEDVLRALNDLQRKADAIELAMQCAVKEQLYDRLGEEFDDGPRLLARSEEDVIDMVGLLFEFILDEPNLPDAVKFQISRLQVPVMKAGILDRTFFGDKDHPVRQLLNALVKAGISIDASSQRSDRILLDAIEMAVNRIVNDYHQDTRLFLQVLDDFREFLQEDAQRCRVLEERTLAAARTREMLLLAKQKVAYEIAIRLYARTIPDAVRGFLFGRWRDVMVLDYLRRDKAPDSWEQSLEIMDRLIALSMLPIPYLKVQSLPSTRSWDDLLLSIRTRLESLAIDQLNINKEMALLHDSRACPVIDVIPEGARSEKIDLQITGILHSTGEVPNIPKEIQDRIVQLKTGQAVEFVNPDQVVKARLCWKSQVSGIHVFINRQGAKVKELSFFELADELANNTIRLVNESDEPIMDRAVDSMINILKGIQPDSGSYSITV